MNEVNQLHLAAISGSIERTLAVLAGGTVDIDKGDLGGSTPLMVAALMGHSHIVQALLETGAKVSIVANDGSTALHYSAQEGSATAVELLAKAGADVDAKTSEGDTPLHWATEGGNSLAARALIEAGANPDSRLPIGVTPLYIAAEEGHLDVMRELLRGKANPLLKQVHSSANTSAIPLEIAAQHGHSDIVRELVQELGIEGCDAERAGAHALALAASNQHLNIMAILTEAGVVDTGKALYLAAGIGHEACVKFLLRHGHKESGCGVEDAYVNACEIDGNTPLVICIQGCSQHAPRIVRMLIDAGADTTSPVRVTNAKGELAFNDTPLGFTAMFFREKLVEDCKPATEEHLHRLEVIRRLLLRVEAVNAVSWSWPSNDAPFIGHDAEIGPEPPLPLLRLMLPMVKRSTKRRGELVATFLRHSVKA